MATGKQFLLNASEIIELAPGRGGCIASDRIVVDGCPVRFMYREPPDNAIDSGWRFLSGSESDEDMDEPSSHGIYDINTIANYDRSVIPLLDEPVGSAIEKVPGASVFVPVEPPDTD